jgi:hypothetical protein
LCLTNTGINAIDKYTLAPFIDSSCRREPDFENPYPSITALCRQGTFAPHLKIDDIVVYITVCGKQEPFKFGYHLVAILQVTDVYETHSIAQEEYLKTGLPIPSNCMVSDNPPLEFSRTGGNFSKKSDEKRFFSKTHEKQKEIGRKRIQSWDRSYFYKSQKWKCFVKTNPLYLNTKNPPTVLMSDFKKILGKPPYTRTPSLISEDQLIKLAELVKVELVVKSNATNSK